MILVQEIDNFCNVISGSLVETSPCVLTKRGYTAYGTACV